MLNANTHLLKTLTCLDVMLNVQPESRDNSHHVGEELSVRGQGFDRLPQSVKADVLLSAGADHVCLDSVASLQGQT